MILVGKMTANKCNLNTKNALNMRKILILGLILLMKISFTSYAEDVNPKAVLIGNSITEMWLKLHPEFFKENNFIGKGISGQVTEQILTRFQEDVIDLNPEIVVIGGGINDIAENKGAYNEAKTLENIISMAEMAQANGIKVVLSSILPTDHIPWNSSVTEVPKKIKSLNSKIKDYSDKNNISFVDYFSALDNGDCQLPKALTTDGLHLTKEGYSIMENSIMPVLECLNNNGAVIEISLWQDEKPAYENKLPSDAEKEENEDWITLVTTPELYVYPASNPNGTALLMCPGGGYYGVAMSHEGKEMAEILNPIGVTLAVLKYRMPNGNSEVPQEDVWKALEILHSRAEEWGINSDKIGIGGASAGGHLASTVSTHTKVDSLKPAFQVLLYPVISMKEGVTHQGSKTNLLGENPSNETIDYYSNELKVNQNTPSAFIAVSGDDDVVPVENSLLYYDALRKNGINATLHIYPEGGHGWAMRKGFKYHNEWIAEILKWISEL